MITTTKIIRSRPFMQDLFMLPFWALFLFSTTCRTVVATSASGGINSASDTSDGTTTNNNEERPTTATATTIDPPTGKTSNDNNILLLLTDDQDVVLGSFDYMPKTKQLLQQQGMTFDNYFVHTPVCCPSRSTMLTGRYLHNCGARNNSLTGNCYGNKWKSHMEKQHTYNLVAKQAGYTTVYAGKYLNQYGRCGGDGGDDDGEEEEEGNKICSDIPPGWDHWLGLVGNSVYYNYTLVEGGSNQSTTIHKHGDNYEKDYLPDVMMNYTMDLLTHNKLPEPWLIVMSWPSCHAPFTPSPKFNGTMSDIDSPKSGNYNASDMYMQQKHWLLRQLHPLSNKTSQQMNKYYQMRLENLKTIDDHIETFVETLEHNDQLDATVVMYTSDNGFNFGQFRLFDKRHLYENDIRVPFVIRGPNIAPNTTSKQLAASIDIAPTIVDIIQGNQKQKMMKKISIDGNDNNIDVDIDGGHDGLSMWKYVQGIPDPCFLSRTDMLISYHGEGNIRCGLADCPPPWDSIWWMPDAFNNTYHCVRTVRQSSGRSRRIVDKKRQQRRLHQKEDDEDNNNDNNEEDSIYCRFEDDENFVEYYNLKTNPQQLSNDYNELDNFQRQRYEHRLKELMSCHGPTCQGRQHQQLSSTCSSIISSAA